MRRLAVLAVLALALFAVPAVAQTTDTPDASAACTHPDDDDGAVLTAASARSRGDGGVPAGFDGGGSGGTPADWDGESSDASTLADDGTTGADDATTTGCDDSATTGSESLTATGAGGATTGSGGALAASAGGPSATAAQEPTPQPEGPGTQQPGDPGTQPPPIDAPPTGPDPEPLAEQAPAGGVGGSLPVTGVEVLQLALLGLALLLVGARLRVLALRRKRGPAEPTWREADLAYEEDFSEPITARRATAPRPQQRVTMPRPERRATTPRPARRAQPAPSRHAERDEWSFPDPNEPAPTGLLPSTASARRRARALAAERD